jgi:UDP-3-O-[3-hydroxymyristoyl] glucosamine N-acyltransferase
MEGLTLGEIALKLGLTLNGNPSDRVTHVATLKSAQPGALTFLANSKYRDDLSSTRATVVVCREADVAQCPTAALIAQDPYVAYAQIATWLHPKRATSGGVHPSAVVDPTAIVPVSATIAAQAYIGPRVVVGERVSVGVGSALVSDIHLGDDTQIGPKVSIYPHVNVGARCLIHGGAVLGADGFGMAMNQGQWLKVPQVGGVRLGNDVEVGANTTIDRGAIEDTIIEDDVHLDNQIQVGHNVRIGAHTAIAGCVGISGSTHIGQYCMIAGFVGIAGHLKIADRTVILGFSLVSHSIDEAGVYSSGIPVEEAKTWRRTVGRLRQLDELNKKVKRLVKLQDGEE